MWTGGWRAPWRGRDEGAVAVEFALAMPSVIIVLGLCLSAVTATSVQVRVQDAAGEAARLSARGDSTAGAIPLAGAGASVSEWDAGEFRCVRVQAPVPILGLRLGLTASADSCALRDVG